MYNFLDPKLSPKVTCSVPSLDDYEVTNLISDNYNRKIRGFSADTIVTPPVEITFEVICPLNIDYIVLWTTIGRQKCTALEILAKSCSNKEFTSIAYANFNANGIVFCNNRTYSANNPPRNVDPSFSVFFFKNSALRQFTTATFIQVRILRTERTVPCLARIEIWGQPSKLCTPTTINTINHLIHKSTIKSDSKPPETKRETLMEEWKIPDEFKDSLTFDVMAIPITLPSGNNVDQSTLEKYLQVEASYGRMPSDPFTGQKFTDTHKPAYNAALKSRIDMFLIANSSREETFGIKRTLGFKSVPKEASSYGAKRLCVGNSSTVRHVNYEDLDEKLNEAINKTMNSSHFIHFSDPQGSASNKEPENKCCLCKDKNTLYTIPCGHLYCRRCLFKICVKCKECNKDFSKKDVKRFMF